MGSASVFTLKNMAWIIYHKYCVQEEESQEFSLPFPEKPCYTESHKLLKNEG